MTEPGTDNLLYYGDNLDILRRYIKDETIDLVYLDPPFKSNQDYNVLFKERGGKQSAAQIRAFEDTWQWDESAARSYQEVVEAGGKVSQAMQAFHTYLGTNDMLAYLAMMAPRLVELRRVLKPTGSIYLHCDPTASHYLKILMDAVFGPGSFRNEIVWKRKSGRGETNRKAFRFGVMTDYILYFSKTREAPFNRVYKPSRAEYIEECYKHVEPETGRRYQADNLASPSPRPNLMYTYKGYEPPPLGWAISREKMEQWDREGRLHFPSSKDGRIRRKRYLDELPGETVQNLWDDIPPIGAQAAERMGYPTQKPEALLERIINASSKKGNLVLDPFCGCGTTVVVAQKLDRRWIGIDITHLAINLMKRRLRDTFGKDVQFEVVGEPRDLSGAEALAKQDPYQFQWWALGLVDARPVEQKKGSDKGIDGRIYFHDEQDSSKTKQVVLSVKAGHTGVAHVRDLRGVLDREQAAIGVLITMEEPTQPMRAEAADASFYHSPNWNKDYPRIQLRTIAELLAGKGIDCPQHSATFKQAPQYVRNGNHQLDAWTAPVTTDAEPVAVSDKPRKTKRRLADT